MRVILALLTLFAALALGFFLRTLVVRACYAFVLVVIFIAELLIWDVQLALSITIITGVLTFALRDLIKDQVAGIYILAEHQFQIGDQITISSSTGVVTHINMRGCEQRRGTSNYFARGDRPG